MRFNRLELPKKFCVVSQYWSPDVVGDVSRVKQIVKGLRQLGRDVVIITSQPHYPKGDRKGFKFKFLSSSYEEGVLVLRLGMPSLPHSSFGPRFIMYTWFAAASLLPSLIWGRGRVHWVFSQRVFASYPAMIARIFFRRTTIADITDIWPEAAVNSGLLDDNSFLFKIGRLAARFAYRSASFVTTMTKSMEKFLMERYGVDSSRVVIIPYGGIRHEVSLEPSDKHFLVLYYGNLGPAYDFDVVLDAARELKNEHVMFVVRADGPGLGRLMKNKERMRASNLEIVPRLLSESELSSLISRSAVMVLPMKSQMYGDVSFPGKIIEYIQDGRPIVYSGTGYPSALIAKYQVGLTVSPGDYLGVARAIRQIKEDENLRKRFIANAVDASKSDFGERVVMGPLKELLSRVEG